MLKKMPGEQKLNFTYIIEAQKVGAQICTRFNHPWYRVLVSIDALVASAPVIFKSLCASIQKFGQILS